MKNKELLSLTQSKAFNANHTKSKRDENKLILRHTLKKLIELEKLESFKIFATENVNKIIKNKAFEYEYEEADILKKRILFPLEKVLAKDSKEALQKTINDKGYICLKTLQSYLPDKNLDEILKDLSEKELIFPDLKEKKEYCLKNEFLSGNIKEKAFYLEKMIEHKDDFKVYTALSKERYLEILRENFPKNIPYEDIKINFGANFINIKIYEDFIQQSFFNEPLKINVQINKLMGEYIIEDFTKNIGETEISISQSDLNDLAKELEVKISKSTNIAVEYNNIKTLFNSVVQAGLKSRHPHRIRLLLYLYFLNV